MVVSFPAKRRLIMKSAIASSSKLSSQQHSIQQTFKLQTHSYLCNHKQKSPLNKSSITSQQHFIQPNKVMLTSTVLQSQSSPKNLNFIPTKTQQHSSHELNSVEFPFYQFKTSNTFQTLTFQKQPIQQAL